MSSATGPSSTSNGKVDQDIIVYSCVAGGYDQALMPVKPETGLRFVCFTDDKRLKSPGWEILELQHPKRLSSGHDINRFHKLFPHRIFPDNRWSIYIDGNIRYAGDWRALISPVADAGGAIGAFSHPRGHNLLREVELCRESRFDLRDHSVAELQLTFYKAHGIDVCRVISANRILVRDHTHPKLGGVMSLWWSQLFEFSKRDQISLQFALEQNGIDWIPLDGPNGVDQALVSRAWHRLPFPQRLQRAFKKAKGKFGLRH